MSDLERARERRRRWARSEHGRSRIRAWNEENVHRRRGYTAAYRARLKAKIDAIKLESGCVDCGYRKHPVALDFDHRDPTEKIGSVAELIRSSGVWSVIEEEIGKCDVRCANCHRIRTAEKKD